MRTFAKILAGAVLATGMAAMLPGCQTQMAQIPGNAPMVASANGTLTYTPTHDGDIYIYDKTWNKMVYSGFVRAGQTVKVDAPAGKVFVDGRPVVEQIPLGEGSEYQVFLQTTGTMVEKRTVIEEQNAPIERRTVIERDIDH